MPVAEIIPPARPAAVESPADGGAVGAGTRPSEPIRVARAVARRYLVLHHFLAPPRSLPGGRAGILAVFDRLGSIQFDPIEVAGRNHDLVLLSRVAGYRREQTDELLYETRELY